MPPDELQPFVKYTSFIETEVGNGMQKTFVPVVDGCPGIMIQDPDYGTITREGKELPAFFLFGQATRHSELKLDGAFKAMYVYLQPHAVGSLFKLNAESLTDSCVDLTLLIKGREFAERWSEAGSKAKKVAALNSYLLDHSALRGPDQDAAVNYVLQKIISGRGACQLQDLQREVHLSERSLERRFKQQVGISARLFSKICRFQSSFKQLHSRDFVKLTDIAFDNDYSDQSHFIRAFREFAGMSPLQYQKKYSLTAENLSEALR